VHAFLVWLESTELNQWIVGSPSLWAFPGILAVHAIGMGFAAGLSAAIDLRVLGIAPEVPMREMRRFLPMLWTGFWLNAVSGVLLLIGYPTKALTNPLFYVKLFLVGLAMVLVRRISRQLTDDHTPAGATTPMSAARLRWLAIASLSVAADGFAIVKSFPVAHFSV
jgi:hypothetical protein